MALPWKTIERVDTEEGVLELRQRGEKDFLITVGGRVLMNSTSHRTETALGRLACEPVKKRPAPAVLVGGLGMGYTLRAVLDSLPADARVTVAEINPKVVSWCRGPLAKLTDGAVFDPRVHIKAGDVARHFGGRKGAAGPRYDAVAYDLYTGPYARTHKEKDPLYGRAALKAVFAALTPGGVFAVWGEEPDAGFVKRLESAGFSTALKRPRKGGPRHVIYLAARPA